MIQAEKTEIQTPSPLRMMDASELLSLPEVEEEFLVDGLLPSAGLSLLIAPPKDGKSCLARQLAVDVAQGNSFLDRKTKQGGVLLFALEESQPQVTKRLRNAGMRHGDPIRLHVGMLRIADLQATINATVNRYDDTVLIIVDTLFKLVRVRDSNAYAETQNALEWLHDLGTKKNIAILGLHHSKKVVLDDQRTSMKANGSTAIAAASTNSLDLGRMVPSDPKSQRVLRMNEYRYGDGMEPSVLDFDVETQRYSISGSLTDFKRQETEEAKSEIKTKLLQYVQAHPGCNEKEIRRDVTGRVQTKNEALRSSVETGLLRRDGNGTKNDPYRYFLIGIPHDDLLGLQDTYAENDKQVKVNDSGHD